VKEIKLRPGIDKHDYEVKMKDVQRLFEESDTVKVTLRFRNPVLPRFLEAVELFNLKLGDARADIRLHRHGGDVTVSVTRRVGDVQIAMLK